MLMECILISSSFCQAVKANLAKPVLGRKQNAVAAVLKDCPVATMMAAHLAAKTMDYRQTERDFLLGGFREHDVMLRPMLGHPAAMYAYDAAYATGAAWLGDKMRRSRFGVMRKLWWLPQTYSIQQNVSGYLYTRGHYTR
jgi:hypothetical protein